MVPVMEQQMVNQQQQDPNQMNLMMQQQQMQYEHMPMAAQYMMMQQPTYYQPTVVGAQDGFYNQLQQFQMYGDPSPSNLQQLQMMQMQGMQGVPEPHHETEKKADPPLPTDLQFLDPTVPDQVGVEEKQMD